MDKKNLVPVHSNFPSVYFSGICANVLLWFVFSPEERRKRKEWQGWKGDGDENDSICFQGGDADDDDVNGDDAFGGSFDAVLCFVGFCPCLCPSSVRRPSSVCRSVSALRGDTSRRKIWRE